MPGPERRSPESSPNETDRRKYQLKKTAVSLGIPLRNLEGENFVQIQRFVGIVLDTDNISREMEHVRKSLNRSISYPDTQKAYTTAITLLGIKQQLLREGFAGQQLYVPGLKRGLTDIAIQFGWQIEEGENDFSKGFANSAWQARTPQQVSPDLRIRAGGWWDAIPRVADRLDAGEHFKRIGEKQKVLPKFFDREGIVSSIVDLEQLAEREEAAQELPDVEGLFPVARERFARVQPLSSLAKNLVEDSFRKPELKTLDRIEVARALVHVTKPYNLIIVDAYPRE